VNRGTAPSMGKTLWFYNVHKRGKRKRLRRRARGVSRRASGKKPVKNCAALRVAGLTKTIRERKKPELRQEE